MGGVLCKQRSLPRSQHSAPSRRKKLHRLDCLLRGPCLLCFIVHGEHPASESASPDLPPAQDCARLLLLCPGELSTWQEEGLRGGLVRGPGVLCSAIDPQPEDDMLCKRKNCGENQQPRTPCKQPRCAPDTEETHPHCEDLSPGSGREATHPHCEDLSLGSERGTAHPHDEDLSLCSGGGTTHSQSGDPAPCTEGRTVHPQGNLSPGFQEEGTPPHCEDLPFCSAGEVAHSNCENLSLGSGGTTIHPQSGNQLYPAVMTLHPTYEDILLVSGGGRVHSKNGDQSAFPGGEIVNQNTGGPSSCSAGENIHPHCEDLSVCSGGETIQPPIVDPLPCPVGEASHSQSTNLSLCPVGKTVYPKPGNLSLSCIIESEHPRGMSQAPGGLIRPSAEVLAPICSDSQTLHYQETWQPTGDPALTYSEQNVCSMPGNISQNSIEEQLPSSSRGLTPSFAEDHGLNRSATKTLQEEGHITGGPVFSCTGECKQQLAKDSAIRCTEDHGKPFEKHSCSNKISSCSTMCLDHIASSLATPHVDLHSSGSNQAPLSQSPKVEGEALVPCESLHINQLPPSLLLKILSNLSLNERCLSASLVCKYWRDLCLDFQFWKQLDLSTRQQVKDSLLEKIASRSWNIMEMNISDCLNVTDAGICKLAMNCSGLVKYTAYRCKQLSDQSLISLATHCPSLQKVHVGNQDRLTDKALYQLGSRCKDLRDIHFGQCYKISDEGMAIIAKGCPKLQKIYMQENKLVTNRSVEAFAEHCPELQYVGFMGCSVTSHGVIHLTRLKNLSSLDLRNITELDNQTVVEIVKKCQNLTSLNLCLNRNIDDRCIEVIAKEGRSLKELYLVTCKITDHALIAIGRYSSTIETVDVGWCKEITDQGATLIAQSSKSIRYLGLMRCDQVNETTVEQLVQQYPHITFSTVLQDCKRTLERAYQMGWTPNASSIS